MTWLELFIFACEIGCFSVCRSPSPSTALLRPPSIHHLTFYALAKHRAGDHRAALPLTCWCLEVNLHNSHLEKEVTEPCLRDAGKGTWDNVHKMPSSGPWHIYGRDRKMQMKREIHNNGCDYFKHLPLLKNPTSAFSLGRASEAGANRLNVY